MKRFDPANPERHYRAAEVAEMLSIGYTTALRLIKRHPSCKYLPATTRNGRTRRTPLLAASALKELYEVEMERR